MPSTRNGEDDLDDQGARDHSHPTVLLLAGTGLQPGARPDQLCELIAEQGFHVVRMHDRTWVRRRARPSRHRTRALHAGDPAGGVVDVPCTLACAGPRCGGRAGCAEQDVPLAGGRTVTRYVVGPDVAVRLAADRIEVRGDHELLAPALLRSQVLSLLYRAVQRGELTDAEAQRRLAAVRRLRMRLLGDRVLQDVAWKVAAQLGWPDTTDAEYVALTQLQADALVTLDERLARAIGDLVPLAPVEALSSPH